MSDAPISREMPIINRKGLHARASAKFVQCVENFDVEITVTKDGQSASGNSIMGLMMLAAGIGSSIEVSASGPDAAAAMDAIEALVGNRFGEDE